MSVVYSPRAGRIATAVPAADGELDLAAVGQAVWRRKWYILILALVVAAATLFIVNSITPRYGSEARVLIDGRENIFLRPDAEKTTIERATVDDQAVASQVQVLLSRDLARQVIDKLKLKQRPEFDPLLHGIPVTTRVLAWLGLVKDPLKMTKEERVLQAYYDRLKVFAIEKSRVIAIDFQSADPDLAAAAANAVAEGYLGVLREAKQDQARSASQWLSGEIDKLRKKVSDAEAKVAEYRAKSNLFVGGPNNASLANQQLTDLNAQVAAARARKADAEARAQLIRDILKSGRTIEASDVVDSDLIRRLAEQRGTLMAQLAEQSSTLLDQHPRIKELKAQISDLNTQIRQEAVRRVRALENEARIADARLQSLTASLDQLKGQAATSNEADVHLRALEREAKSERDLLESYLAKYREAAARDTINAVPADARVISRATVSNIPVFPKRIPTVLVATALALMLGIGFTTTQALLDPNNFRAVSNDELPMERLPLATPARIGSRVDEEPRAPVSPHAVDQLAEDIRDAGDACERVIVIGARRGVGTSQAAISLARALARDRRVALVDLALDAPHLAAASANPDAPGIVDVIEGEATAGEVITRDQISPLHLVGAGRRAKDVSAVLQSPKLAVFIDALGRTYDHVIIDAGTVTDKSAERLAALAPTGVLVVGQPPADNVEAARERLRTAGFDDVTVLAAAA